MKIARLDAVPLRIPFSTGATATRSGGQNWKTLEIVLVRAETDDGIVGWGEAFSYSCIAPVVAAVETMVAPLIVGREINDIATIMRTLQYNLHLFGRYGITMFALSGLDMALWDIAAKRLDMPLGKFIDGGARTGTLEGYASLYNYGDPAMVATKCREALDQGYRVIKLHETTEPAVAAARDAIGADIPLTVDTNCPWTPEEARAMALRFKPHDLLWLEEPIFPPEDFSALAALQKDVGIALAAGENACTAYQFAAMLATEAVTYVQPSVTKVGGITEFLKVADLVAAKGVKLMPHSPYLGPGFLATLHLIAALPDSGYVERLFIDVEASLYGDLIDPVAGRFRVPEAAGIGPDPDPDVIRDYRV